MKKKLLVVLLVVSLIPLTVGCGSSSDNSDIGLKVKNQLTDYAIEFEDINSINDLDALDKINELSDGWSLLWKDALQSNSSKDSFGCTGIMKELDGQMVMGRNMDYMVNDKAEAVFKVDTGDRYKSINVSNVSLKGMKNYSEIIKDGGISAKDANTLSYFVTDGLNEKGLTLELNMRPTEYEKDGKTLRIVSNSTNPGKIRAPIPALTRIALDKAANVEELLKLVGAYDAKTGEQYGNGGKFDFYTNLSPASNWALTFAVMDASGRHGVLEPINNKLVWQEDAKGQANFFQDEETEKTELYGAGYGRWDYAMKNYDKISTQDELFDLMGKITYKQIEENKAPFDISTENCHSDVFGTVERLSAFAKKNGITIPDTSKLRQTITTNDGKDAVLTMDNYKQYDPDVRAARWTKDFVQKDVTGEVKAKEEWTAAFYKNLSDEQVRECNFFWNTAHRELYNATNKTLKIEFWEDGKTFDFSL